MITHQTDIGIEQWSADDGPETSTRDTPDPIPQRTSARGALKIGLALLVALSLGSVAGLLSAGTGAGWLAAAWGAWRGTILNPWYAVFLLGLLVLQWRYPARPELPGASVGLGQDLVWFVMSAALGVTVVAGYLNLLESAYSAVAGDWSLNLETQLGSWGLPLAALVVTDFIGWSSHYLHHKVPVLWSFHAVHHSQEQMNVLSDSRQHMVETMITATMVFLPARIMGLDAPAASALAFLSIYVGAFIHANIRTNLGPARFLVISPQAHRVHHSAAPEHIDTNFGVILACWDHLFGTRYVHDDEYPTTGIHDQEFPLEHSAHPRALAGTWLRQFAYPFRMLRAHRSGSALSSASTAEMTSPT